MKKFTNCPICSNHKGTNSGISTHMRAAHNIALSAWEKLSAAERTALSSASATAPAVPTPVFAKRSHGGVKRPAVAIANGSTAAPLARVSNVNVIQTQTRAFFSLALDHPEIRDYWLAEIETRRIQLQNVAALFPAVAQTISAGGGQGYPLTQGQ